MAKKKKQSKFGAKVGSNVKKQKTGATSYGYLKLPKGISVYKEPPGHRVVLDIIPYNVTNPKHMDRDEDNGIAMVDDQWFKAPFFVHKGIGAEEETVVCPKSFGKPCPICEYRAKRMKEGADKDETDAFKQSKRNLYFVIPRQDKKLKDGIDELHVWDISQYLFQDKLNEELEEDERNLDFPDLECGLSLKIRFSEEIFKKFTFAKTSRIDFIERDEEIGEDFIDEVPSLDDCLNLHPYDKLEKMFFEMEEPETDSDEEEEEEEERTPRKKKTSKKQVEEDDEEEEEEEEKPKKKSKKKVEPEEEEEEEKPKKASKKSRRKKKKVNEEECPKGYTFGEDVDEYDECEDCPLYDACAIKYDEING